MASPLRLDGGRVEELLRDCDELHALWQHDPADAVGHDPVQSKLFDPHRRGHRRFGVAFVRLLGAAGERGRALELLDARIERVREDERADDES